LELHHERVAKLVHHHAGQIVGLAPDEPPAAGLEQLAPGEGPFQRPAHIGRIEPRALATEATPDDLRFRVVDAGAKKPVRAIPAFDHLAVVLRGQQHLDFVRKYPGMPLQHAGLGVRFEFERGQRHGALSSQPV